MSDLKTIDILLLNQTENSNEPFIKEDAGSSNDFDKSFINFPNISKKDIKLLIKEINELPCCLNEFLEKKMKTPKERFQLLELRNKNIKIKFLSTTYLTKEIIMC